MREVRAIIRTFSILLVVRMFFRFRNVSGLSLSERRVVSAHVILRLFCPERKRGSICVTLYGGVVSRAAMGCQISCLSSARDMRSY